MEPLVLVGALAALLVIGLLFRRRAEGRWRTSSRGNATTTISGARVTVFESDGGWKYCLADPTEGGAPYYSQVFETQDAAKGAAIAHASGDASAESGDEGMWVSFLKERGAALDLMNARVPAALADTNLSLEGATKLYRVLEEHAQTMEKALEIMHRRGVDGRIIQLAERMEEAVGDLAAAAAKKVFELKNIRVPSGPRSSRKPT